MQVKCVHRALLHRVLASHLVRYELANKQSLPERDVIVGHTVRPNGWQTNKFNGETEVNTAYARNLFLFVTFISKKLSIQLYNKYNLCNIYLTYHDTVVRRFYSNQGTFHLLEKRKV